MVKEFFEIDGYEQIVYRSDSIEDVSCTCRWGTIHRDAWVKGTKICKHIMAILEVTRQREKNIRN